MQTQVIGMAIRVLLADDHAVVRQALSLLLEREGFEIVGQAADGDEAWRMARDLTPDVAVLDLMMPVMNGIESAREIRRASPQTATILLTGKTEDRHVLDALQEGIKGCALKTHEARDLIQAVREVARGGRYLSPGLSRAVIDSYVSGNGSPRDVLTPRERQVLKLIAEGRKTREIGEILPDAVVILYDQDPRHHHLPSARNVQATSG